MVNNKKEENFLYGLKELAEFLCVSVPTAHKYKKQLAGTYMQIGRTIIFDKQEVINKLKEANQIPWTYSK